MSRSLSPDTIARYRANVYQRAFMAYIDYPSDPVAANNRTFPIPFDWNGSGSDTLFLGVGEFASISVLNELAERSVQRLSLSLNGLDPDLLRKHLQDNYRGRIGYVWEACLDESWQLTEAALVFAGTIASQRVQLGRLASITVTLASIEEDWETVRTATYNGRDQRRIPGREDDEGLDWVETYAKGRPIKWGRA